MILVLFTVVLYYLYITSLLVLICNVGYKRFDGFVFWMFSFCVNVTAATVTV